VNVLVDANILLRSAEPGHAMHPPAKAAVTTLLAQGYTPCIVPQVIYEFWVVCTRPTGVNGLGKTAAEAATELTAIKTDFTLLDDTPALLPTWESLVATYGIVGKNAHDARLVAAMLIHGVGHILTFNDKDFRPYPITVLTPTNVLATPPATPTPPPRP
jgi:predicted nucleic acid-binding protein